MMELDEATLVSYYYYISAGGLDDNPSHLGYERIVYGNLCDTTARTHSRGFIENTYEIIFFLSNNKKFSLLE